MRIQIQPAALADLIESAEFHTKYSPGFARKYIEAMFVMIDQLAETAGIHQKEFDCHRVVNPRFYTKIFYTIEPGLVVVHAVLDCRRDPDWIREQLSARSIG